MTSSTPSNRPEFFDLDVNGAGYNRLQAQLKFRLSALLAGASTVLFLVAGGAWAFRWGNAPDHTVTTTSQEGGQIDSIVVITTSANPLMGVPVALAAVGVMLLVPIVSWAIAPGSRVKGPLGTEGGADHPEIEPDSLANARLTSQAAIARTHEEIPSIVMRASPSVDAPSSQERSNTQSDDPRRKNAHLDESENPEGCLP